MEQRPAIIDGERVTTDEFSSVSSPYDGQVIGTVAVCDRSHVDRAVAAAKTALRTNPLPAWQRAEILDRAAARLADEHVAAQLAELVAREAAKPVAAATVEVARAVSTFQFSAAVCRTLAGDVLPLDASQAGEGRLGFTLRVPIGVVGAVSPFNFPVNLVAHKLAPAIAAGCPVVLKPAGQTPLSALALAQILLDDCGLPAGYLHVVTGPGSTVGDALVMHDDVAMITFTGSPDVGWGIRGAAPRKKVALELGNNAPVIVEPDADWRDAAARIALAGNAHAGQSCISVQRIYVHRDIADAFCDALVAEVEALVVGDPLDPETQVSALISDREATRVADWVRDAVAEGARVLTGGGQPEAALLRPTVLADVTPDMQVCRDEVFGPVVSVQIYDHVDDAFAWANDTRYGLHAGIFTNDLTVARRAIGVLDFGGVIVNDVPTWRADLMPYGGLRDSGNTREGPAYTIREMTEIRTAVVR